MTTTTNPLEAVWHHLDALRVGTESIEQDLINASIQAIDATMAALMTDEEIDREGLALALAGVSGRLDLAQHHLDNVVLALGEVVTA
jgi:RNase P/RNase MRP subunit POP5